MGWHTVKSRYCETYTGMARLRLPTRCAAHSCVAKHPIMPANSSDLGDGHRMVQFPSLSSLFGVDTEVG
jgi:hypothetical protein